MGEGIEKFIKVWKVKEKLKKNSETTNIKFQEWQNFEEDETENSFLEKEDEIGACLFCPESQSSILEFN